MDGWIKLYRATLENPIATKDAEHLAIWTWLLLKATWKESSVIFNGERINLKAGDLPPISRKTIAKALNISESKVQRVLKTFEIERMIEQQTNNHNRLISIVSWEKYQQDEQQTEPQVNSNRTASEQQVNTIEESKKEIRVKSNNYISIKGKEEKLQRKWGDEEFQETGYVPTLDELVNGRKFRSHLM